MPAPRPSADERGPRWGLSRVGVLAVAASFVVIWGYVLYLSVFEGRADPRDRLSDPTWAETAEATCVETRAMVDELPLANTMDTPTDRAEVLDTATLELERMVTRLRALIPPSAADEARAVSLWLSDWETFNQDRREYATRFREGLDEPFRMTARGGQHISTLIDEFALANDMESCATPPDVG